MVLICDCCMELYRLSEKAYSAAKEIFMDARDLSLPWNEVILALAMDYIRINNWSKDKKAKLCSFAQIGLQEHSPRMIGNAAVARGLYEAGIGLMSSYPGTPSTEVLERALVSAARRFQDVVFPGYTHLQRAQPVTFSHWAIAYAEMFDRDYLRLCSTQKLLNRCPLGSAALAGTAYPVDREKLAKDLGFDEATRNSLDSVSDRDHIMELLSDASISMVHLSRFAEDLILYNSGECGFVELSDGVTSGSSLMPQKKNPDSLELIRGKTGRVYGDLITLLTVMKGLPLAYNKDMQEDKEPVFDAVDTVTACLDVYAGMIKTMKAKTDNMKKAAQKGFINATDLADYLAVKGLPFRTAYKISGQIVSYCIKNNKTLQDLTLDEYSEFSDLFDEEVYSAIDLDNCVSRRKSFGGTSVQSVVEQIKYVKEAIK